MKTIPTQALRQKSQTALLEEIKALQKSYFGLRMQKATRQLTDTSALKKARRSVARVKTILLETLLKTSSAVSAVSAPSGVAK